MYRRLKGHLHHLQKPWSHHIDDEWIKMKYLNSYMPFEPTNFKSLQVRHNYHLMTSNQVRDQHGNIVDPQVVHQREVNDARLCAAIKQKRLDERNKKTKFDHVMNLKDLSKQEYREFCHRRYYSMPKDNTSAYFWRSEHKMIYKQVYAPMSTKVWPMKYWYCSLIQG
jgi:hypothetical protein